MKKKKKIKKSFLLLITCGLILGAGVFYISNKKEVAKPASNEVKDLMNKNNINETDYSKTLEYVLLNNIYDEKYLKEYKDIKFNDASNFEEILTTFLPKGYTGKEINYIFKLSEKNINILKKLDYKDISNYYVIKNFNANNIERYDEYKKKNDINYKDVVTRVNIKLDLPVYTDTKEVEDGNDYLVLVNKYNHLPKNYRPTDLAYIPGAYGNNVPMRSITKDAFLELQDAAKTIYENKLTLEEYIDLYVIEY